MKLRQDSPDWYRPLQALKSLGQSTRKATSLADLHNTRRENLAQFFTPNWLAALMWRIATSVGQDAQAPDRKLSVIDTSVGSGRLLQWCDPAKHMVGGIDIHGPVLQTVEQTFKAAGFTTHFEQGDFAAMRHRGWDIALINPPFSIQIEHAAMRRFASNAWGQYGKGTSARSDRYAVLDALSAQVVVALVPASTALWAKQAWEQLQALEAQPGSHDADKEMVSVSKQLARLCAVVDLPHDAFATEGCASVETALLVFGSETSTQVAHTAFEGVTDEWLAALPLSPLDRSLRGKPVIEPAAGSNASITLPVTHINTVKLVHRKRMLKLKFECGFAQARVMNDLLMKPNVGAFNQRLPLMYPYAGSARLDTEALLLDEDPVAALDELIARIQERGAVQISVQRGLREWLQRRHRRSLRQRAPFGRTVFDADGVSNAKEVIATARVPIVTGKGWSSWVIDRGETHCFTRQDGKYVATSAKGQVYTTTLDELQRDFALQPASGAGSDGWVQVHPALQTQFPDVARAIEGQLQRSTIPHWLSWKYQQQDLVELAMKPYGAIAGWDTGLGKTRLAVALALLLGAKHALLVTYAFLIPEFEAKLSELNLGDGKWKTLRSSTDVSDLAGINLVSYEFLRSMCSPRSANRCGWAAKKLRKMISVLLLDEGELISRQDSQQTMAVCGLRPKRTYIFSATPMADYPRSVHPLLIQASGDGTAAQPYGMQAPHLVPELLKGAQIAQRGVDAFREEFTTLEWATNEFLDTMTTGAKREVPKISNLPAYRALLSPSIKRRLVEEPDVQTHVRIPSVKSIDTHVVEFDEDHLGFYLAAADEFVEWWKRQREGTDRAKSCTLFGVLLKLAQMDSALNIPSAAGPIAGYKPPKGLTSAQRFQIERLQELAEAGEKVFYTAHHPAMLTTLHRELAARGVQSLVVHGRQDISQRYAALKAQYRQGSVPILLASTKCVRGGMDVPEATTVFYGDRDWTYRTEYQVLKRTLRPQTQHDVRVEYCHIEGSLHEYQAQMVAWKRDCFRSGLDFAAPEMHHETFEHVDSFVAGLLEQIAMLRGVKPSELRNTLKLARLEA